MRCAEGRWRVVAPALVLAALAAPAAPATAGAKAAGGAAPQEAPDAGYAALRTGDYDDAKRLLERYVKAAPDDHRARRALAEAWVLTGDYRRARAVLEAAPDPVPVANALGEILLLLGERDAARARFRDAVRGGAADALTAEVNLAETLFMAGEVEEAMRRFDRFIDVYNDAGGRLSAADLVAVGRAVRVLGRRDPALFRDALKAFDEAAAAAPDWHEPHLRAGALFLEKYASPEAKEEFQKVLDVNPRHPDALLGMARALAFDQAPGADALLEQALEVNPHHVGARTTRALRLLTSGHPDGARRDVEQVLEVAPDAPDALAAQAAVAFVEGDDDAFRRTRARALEVAPRHAGLDVTVAQVAERTRRYAEAARRAEAATALDPEAWEAWGLLGMNLLRLGAIEEGRAHLERAFAGDPYNPWFKNTLDLLDRFEEFETVSSRHFRFFLHADEAELLATYLVPLAEEAYDSLRARYGTEPAAPLRAELYPRHADFSVRTLGEAGLGALGVSFGPVLVMDAPGARRRGDYNWASVFWHELAHSFHLAASEHRVPRWFSEGLAVHEQRRARPHWGHQVTIPFLQALREGRLKKVSELDDGFMRPDEPGQVIFSYYQASLVFQLLEEEWGFDAVRRMLEGYREGRTTGELFLEVLGTSLEDFDERFDDYLHTRFEAPLRALTPLGEPPPRGADTDAVVAYARAHPGDFLARLRAGAALLDEERYDEAEAHLKAAVALFPEYAGPDSPYGYLARLHRARGELERAAAAMAQLTARSESNYDALLFQAEVLEELGRDGEAAQALGRAVLVWPYEIEVHERLAELYARAGEKDGAVRERRAVVALGPADRAGALYRLALAEWEAGHRAAARRSVLRALEIAPNYEEALELLLRIRGGTEERR